MPIGRLTQIVLECADVQAEATFWGSVLDLSEASGTADWLCLEWPGVGRLTFNQVEGYVPPEWPGVVGGQQMHFDLLVDDLAIASATVEAAGGSPLSDVMDPGPKEWRIYADPAGHPFCLVTVPE